MGVGMFSALLADIEPGELVGQTVWTIFWAIAYSGLALALLLATLATFNRCLGRVGNPSLFGDDDSPLRGQKIESVEAA